MKIKKIKLGLFIISTFMLLTACTNSNQSNHENMNSKKIENNEIDLKNEEEKNLSNDNHDEDITKETELKTNKEDLFEAVEIAKENAKKADLFLEKVAEENDEVIIKVILKNPQKSQINSVRSFLSFNPEVIKGRNIEIPKNSPFNLIAPGEKDFDNKKGIVKIGMSSTKNPTKSEEIEIAQIKFEKLKNETISFEFFDVQAEGHTKVISIIDNKARDILNPPQTPALIF